MLLFSLLELLDDTSRNKKNVKYPQEPIQKPISTNTPQTYSPPKATFTTYKQYMEALEKLYIQNGNKLADWQIEKFIKDSKIDVANGVTISDVKSDLRDIEKKINAKKSTHKPKSSLQPKSTPQSYAAPKPKSTFTTYKQYMEALERLYVQNGNKLADWQIEKFIKDSKIDVANGVTISDVKSDLRDIEKKLNAKKTTLILCYEDYVSALKAFWDQNGDKSLLDIYIKKFISTYGMDIKKTNTISDIRMDLVFIQSKLPLNSETARGLKKKTDRNVEAVSAVDINYKFQVAEIILKHKEKFSGNSAIKGLLWDYFPEKRKKIMF